MRSTLGLGGRWQLAGFDYGRGGWKSIRAPYPISAEVPGEVHPALMEADIIHDPLMADNAEKVRWVEDKEWWYHRVLRLPAKFERSQTYIEFDGLDTYASVYLNGEELGRAENMFIPYRFDVTGKLKEDDDNVLEVRFEPAVKVLERMGIDFESYYLRYNPIRIGARKMQSSFGWDWMPRLIGAGIWLDTRISSYDQLSIRELNVVPTLVDGTGEARVSVKIEVQSHVPRVVDALAVVRIGMGRETYQEEARTIVRPGGALMEVEVPIKDPKIWWPNGLGNQPLYTAEVKLKSGSRTLDEKNVRFGIRKVELVTRDEDGKPAFFFKVNGVPVYAKGANWIPADAFPSRVTRERYERLLTLARDAGCNMLRAWGGGVYEKPEFYDLCDELGLMVWQDFQFSLAEYPDVDWMANLVNTEAHSVIRRLRNHPSVVLWCGNNECEMDSPAAKVWPGKRFFHEIIPAAIRELDDSRPYWPSSPYGGEVAHSSDYGDYHGEPWFHSASGEKDVHEWRSYLDSDKGLFMSEFPTQGMPEMESLDKVLNGARVFPPDSPMWDLHNVNNVQREEKIGITSQQALLRMIHDTMGEPRDAQELAYMSGVLQGEFLRWQIEYYRRHKFAVGGSLFWCLNDAWPAIGYSVVDYYLRPKPAYYFIKRAFAPVALVLGEQDGSAAAWVVNDREQQVKGTVYTSLLDFQGSLRWQETALSVPANSVTLVWTGPKPEALETSVLIGSLSVEQEVVSRSSYAFTIPRDLHLPDPRIRMSRSYDDERRRLTLRLTADRYVHAVKLLGLPDTALPDDNYFDLFPGEPFTVTIRSLDEREAEMVHPWRPGIPSARGEVRASSNKSR